MGYSLSKSLHLFSVLLACARLRICTLNLRVGLSSHLLHSELMHRQIKPAQGPVSGTCKGTAVCQVLFWEDPLALWSIFAGLWSWCTPTMVLPVFEARQWHKGTRDRCRMELRQSVAGHSRGKVVWRGTGPHRLHQIAAEPHFSRSQHREHALKRPVSLNFRLWQKIKSNGFLLKICSTNLLQPFLFDPLGSIHLNGASFWSYHHNSAVVFIIFSPLQFLLMGLFISLMSHFL